MVETHRRGLQDTEAEEEGLSFSRELLIKQPILELEVTGTWIFVEHPGRNQPSTNTFENHAIVNNVWTWSKWGQRDCSSLKVTLSALTVKCSHHCVD